VPAGHGGVGPAGDPTPCSDAPHTRLDQGVVQTVKPSGKGRAMAERPVPTSVTDGSSRQPVHNHDQAEFTPLSGRPMFARQPPSMPVFDQARHQVAGILAGSCRLRYSVPNDDGHSGDPWESSRQPSLESGYLAPNGRLSTGTASTRR
jgi:hypothetical protein